MKLFIRHSLALAAALSLASPTLLHASPQTEAPVRPTTETPAPNPMDARLFYEILVGEMSAQQGDYSNAYALFLDSARRTQSPKLFARAAGTALMARDGGAALQAVQAWRRADPKSRDAARLEMQTLVGMNRMHSAVEPIRATIELSPNDEQVAAILALPVVFSRTQDKAQAVQITEEALAPFLQRANTAAAAWTTVARIRLAAGQKESALTATLAAQKADKALDAVPIMALELLEAGVDAAEPIVTEFLAAQQSTPVRMHYAKLLMDVGRLDDAQAQLQTAVQHNPEFADAWLLQADLHLQRKQYPASETALKQYLQKAGQSGPAGGTPRGINIASLQAAEMAMRERRVQDAQQALSHFIPQEASTGQMLQLAKLQLDTDQAAAAWITLAELPEDTDEERKEKALATAQLQRYAGEHDKAYETMQTLLQAHPQDTDVLYEAAIAAEQAGNLQHMEQHLRRAIELDPKHHDSLNALGYSFADRNVRLNEARTLIESALKLSPDSLHIQDSLAWLEYREGNLPKAQVMLERIYEEIQDAEIAAHLGEVLWMNGQRDRAQRIWNEALQSAPKNPVLRKTMQRLTGSQP